jgi:hypothetical protein
MGKQHKRDLWLSDIDARQRSVVFPDTVQNEARFWRNLGQQSWTTSTKAGLFVLAIFVFGLLGALLVAAFQAGALFSFILVMLLFCGPIFAAIAWATRRSLRDIERNKHGPRTPRR